MLSVMMALGMLGMLHPFHVSVAEAQWNADATRLQVALRLTPRDLDAALSQATGQRVVLEHAAAAEVERLVGGYLRDRIFLTAEFPQRDAEKNAVQTAEDGAAALEERRRRFHWVGIEQEVRYTWVYFELELPADVARPSDSAGEVWLTNRVILETEPTQINTVQLMRSKVAVAVRTTVEQPSGRLPVSRPVD